MIRFLPLLVLALCFATLSCADDETSSHQFGSAATAPQRTRPFEFKKATVTYHLHIDEARVTEVLHILDFGKKVFIETTWEIPGGETRTTYQYLFQNKVYEVSLTNKTYRNGPQKVFSIKDHGYYDIYDELGTGEVAARGIIRHPNEVLVDQSCHVYQTNKPYLAQEKIWMWKGLEMKLESEFQTGFTVQNLDLSASIPAEMTSFPNGFTLQE
jgi:hypothetical protein